MRLAISAILVLAAVPGIAAGGVSIQKAKGERVKNSYIITLKASANKETSVQMASAEPDSEVTHVRWNSEVFNGFAGVFSDEAIKKMAEDSSVMAIEEDCIVHISAHPNTTQKNAPWGMQRISQRSKTSNQNAAALDFSYKYDQRAGNGTDIYVIDTGINTSHDDFGGRAIWGMTFGGYAKKDGNGHGTHVAGTAIGTRFGVAKKARAYAVKVLADNGSGQLSDVISGITWAVSRSMSSGRPSVINLSLGRGTSQALDRAVNSAADQGVHVAVAAGNDNIDAGETSPARAAGAIAVGGTNISDYRAYFSNYGSAVALLAPAQNIVSTWIGSKTATKTLSGTSMASPHVAGLIAYYISMHGNATPSSIRSKLQSLATAGKLKNLPSGTKNLIANTGIGRG
ncbi:peptidase 1 [Exidia glandulosa HHB12029]|uniref:Peptidase 1 n=1 Tax=Exidia glandulosa HHB12029 TaxID=1314781 RepID=A0A165PZX2_EXIGL|nr:peptidase 1 [Exidia glandulosa HHB12029]